MAAALIRTVRFRARHHLRRPDWSEAENRAAFGHLSDPAGHAHDYRCAVTVSGPLHHGRVMDLAVLDRLLEDEVRAPLDGRHLNTEVPAFGPSGTLPTCEAIAAELARRLEPRLPAPVRLVRVHIAEDDSLAGEWWSEQ